MLTNHNTKDIYEKKVENGSREREKERENVLIRFSVNSTFPTLCQKLLFSLSCFSVLISVILKPFVFKFSIQCELN